MTTAANINGKTIAGTSAVDAVSKSGISAIVGVSVASIPPIPDLTGLVNAWGTFNWVAPATPSALFVDSDFNEYVYYTTSNPYPIDYSVLGGFTPPFPVSLWKDQNDITGNDLAATGGARPLLDVTGQLVSFDGVAMGLRGGNVLYGSAASTTGTIYILFKAGSLVETSVILETGTSAANKSNRISIRMVAGVFTYSVYDQTGVVALPNTKIKTISDSNWHLAACTFDATNGTAANQTGLKIDNSVTGVTSPASADLNQLGVDIGDDLPNIGARNNAASNFFTGSMRDILPFNIGHDATLQTAFYDRFQYLQGVSP